MRWSPPLRPVSIALASSPSLAIYSRLPVSLALTYSIGNGARAGKACDEAVPARAAVPPRAVPIRAAVPVAKAAFSGSLACLSSGRALRSGLD
jgi:hypothetical protein